MSRRSQNHGNAWWATLAVAALSCTTAPTKQTAQQTQDSASPTTACDQLEVAPPSWVASDGHLESLGDASQPVPLVRGIQGGWHIQLVGELDSPKDSVSVTANAQLEGLPFGGNAEPHERYIADYDGCHGTLWTRIFVAPSALEPDTICAAEGRAIAVHIEISGEPEYHLDVDGRVDIDGFGVEHCDNLE